jgi:hypothetical protein
MKYRAKLVILIENGTPPDEIYSHLLIDGHLTRATIIDLLKQSGVSFRLPLTEEEISDERRRYLQELSLSD